MKFSVFIGPIDSNEIGLKENLQIAGLFVSTDIFSDLVFKTPNVGFLNLIEVSFAQIFCMQARLVLQSLSKLQDLPSEHFKSQIPPQSISVSLPFFLPSVQLPTGTSGTQFPLASLCWPAGHSGFGAPETKYLNDNLLSSSEVSKTWHSASP